MIEININGIAWACLADMYARSNPPVDINAEIKKRRGVNWRLHHLSWKEKFTIMDKYTENIPDMACVMVQGIVLRWGPYSDRAELQ